MELLDKRIMIVGASGFGREVLTCVIDILLAANINPEHKICFLETEEFFNNTKEIHEFPVVPEKDFEPQNFLAVIGIGEPNKRKEIVAGLPSNTEFTTLIHPNAQTSKWVKLGEGSIVTAGTILTADIEIGKHTHLNLHTTVGHDCKIGDYCTTAPGTNISGICNIGDRVYFGTNSSVKQGVSICDDVIIGMGGVVVKDITEKGTYIGTPVKKIR